MSLFSAEDRALLLGEFGQDIPVKLNGVTVKTIKGIPQYELVVDSPGGAETGSSVLTLQLDPDEYNSLDKTKKYTFVAENADRSQRGPAQMDGSGFIKLQLTKQ